MPKRLLWSNIYTVRPICGSFTTVFTKYFCYLWALMKVLLSIILNIIEHHLSAIQGSMVTQDITEQLLLPDLHIDSQKYTCQKLSQQHWWGQTHNSFVQPATKFTIETTVYRSKCQCTCISIVFWTSLESFL